MKKRSLASTVVELLSPIVLISLLVRRAERHQRRPCKLHNLLDHLPSIAGISDVTTCMLGIPLNIHAKNIKVDRRLAQVIAYTQVTPDHFPDKIYVEETAEALRNLTTPFQQFLSPTLRSNCSDLMHSMAVAGESGTDGWQPSAADIAAVDSCLGKVTNVNTSSTTAAVSAAAVKLLQAFIDSNGWAYLPSVHVKAANFVGPCCFQSVQVLVKR